MSTINLTEEEVAALHDVAQSYLSELHTEISHTDNRDFKAALKKRYETLQAVLEKLSSAVSQPA
jgi:hypothetical protein